MSLKPVLGHVSSNQVRLYGWDHLAIGVSKDRGLMWEGIKGRVISDHRVWGEPIMVLLIMQEPIRNTAK